MVLAIASGKGGTGKTTVAVSLASLIENSVYIDCDVEEPDGHLFLNPDIRKETVVYKSVPVIDPQMCNICGICSEACEFNAIIALSSEITIFEELCHNCGACIYLCPGKAISESKKSIGIIREGTSKDITFIDGILNIGEASASPVIRELKKKIIQGSFNILDSPPGTACSMVETVKNTDYCILVTESTPFGLHDLKLTIEVLKLIHIPYGVVINKFDASFSEMLNYLKSENIDILAKIPFGRKVAEEYSRGIIPSVAMEQLKCLKNSIEESLLKSKIPGIKELNNL